MVTKRMGGRCERLAHPTRYAGIAATRIQRLSHKHFPAVKMLGNFVYVSDTMSDYTRELKSYLHPITAIILPAGQSAVAAAAGGVTVGSIAWAAGAGNPLAAGGAAAGVTFAIAYILSLAWWRAKIDRASIGDAKKIPPETPPAEVVRVELHQPNSGNYRWVDFLDIPFDRDLLIRAASYLRDRDWDTSNLGGAGKPITRSQAEAIRDWLIGKDLAGWYREDAHTLGWSINGVGRSVLRRLYHLGVSTGAIDPTPPKGSVISQQRIYERMRTHTNSQSDLQLLEDLWRDDVHITGDT